MPETIRQTYFVDVILPLAVPKSYTYRVPNELNKDVEVGKRIVVQFGKSKVYTALIKRVHENPPVAYEAKYLISVLDDRPVVLPGQLALWEWISSYYLCTEGEVMNAALPSALKLASETKILLTIKEDADKNELTDKEYLIIEALEMQQELSIGDVAALLDQKTVYPHIKSLLEKGWIHVSEELSELYKPRLKTFVSLNQVYTNQEKLKELFTILEKAPKQLELLMNFIRLSRQQAELPKASLLAESDSSNAAFNALVDKEVFITTKKEVSRLQADNEDELDHFKLSSSQEQALTDIKTAFTNKQTALLHGITSSGKTQLYIRLIEECIEQGKQALYLLPEIALTNQLIRRLRKYLGDQVGIYHSKFNDQERVEIWKKVLDGSYKVILGARSSIFLPFTDLGLIIVDEEHENSYKQFDPAPRYHARDAAIYLAQLNGAAVLLGSATPSLESFYNAKQGKYALIELKERFGGVSLPEIVLADIKEETKRKTMKSHFSSVLFTAITTALDRKEQVILFQNRRGYSPVLSCALCAYTPQCVHCDVSLTYHKQVNRLQCHYCGYKQAVISECPACGSTHIEQKGFGTEKIEDELSILLPNARIERMDLDTTRKKDGSKQLLADFEDGKIDILVGTQMVSKGLDFDNVSLIGILNADSLLNFPDFRAFERSYQLMAQVSGRAGRRDKKGKVVIQTHNINHPVIEKVISNDYEGLYLSEMEERQSFNYPPYCRMIEINVKHKDPDVLNHASNLLAGQLRQHFGNRVLGPEYPLIARIRNYYIKTILLKIEKQGISMVKVKDLLNKSIAEIGNRPESKGLITQVDVDPA